MGVLSDTMDDYSKSFVYMLQDHLSKSQCDTVFEDQIHHMYIVDTPILDDFPELPKKLDKMDLLSVIVKYDDHWYVISNSLNGHFAKATNLYLHSDSDVFAELPPFFELVLHKYFPFAEQLNCHSVCKRGLDSDGLMLALFCLWSLCGRLRFPTEDIFTCPSSFKAVRNLIEARDFNFPENCLNFKHARPPLINVLQIPREIKLSYLDSAISPIDTKTGHNSNISDVSFSVDNATVVETCHSQGSSPIKPQSVDLNDFLFSDSDFDSSPLKQCNRSRNDKSLNEKVQEKSPNRLDPRGSPAVGPSNDSSSSKSAHSRKRKLDRPTYFSNTNVSRVYSSSTHDINNPNNKTLNTNMTENDKSLNEKVQEKSPNRLDPRGSPAVGPSNDSSSSKSAHSRKRKLDRPTYFSNTNVSRVYSSSTHDINNPNNKTLNTNMTENDKSLNEKVQEKSPNRLDLRGSPAVGPSNDSSSSKSAHYHRSEYHSDITLQSILDNKNDKVFLKPHKRKWLCHGQSCVSKTKVVHYHCPICKKYAARDFIRIVKHAIVCFSKLDQTHSDHLPAEPVNHNISPHIQSCDGSLGLESCSKHNTRTHYHCLICNKHASHTINRAKNHSNKCKAKSLPKYLKPAMNENGHPNLQTVLVCPQRGIYLVRRARQGQAKPVHVIANYLAGTYYCELSKCHDLAKFNANSLNPAKHCDHVQAAIDLVHTHNESDKPDFKDLFKPEFLDQVDKTNKFLPIMTDIANHSVKLNTPLVKSFIPEIISSDHGTSKLIYYSVHAGDVKIKYYNRTKRVLVTYDRDTKKLKCKCEGDYKCEHVRLVSLVVASDPTLNVQRPESVVDEAEVSLARRMMLYRLENKQIPFYLDNQHLVETPLSEFTPHETDCLYCSIPLVHYKQFKRGHIYCHDKVVNNIIINTKICPTCNLEYRYTEYSDGYFNYNNSSFFSNRFMELLLGSWAEHVPIQSQCKIFKKGFRIEYTNMLTKATEAFLSLKVNNEHMYCNQCGKYPIFLTFDAIRSVSCTIDPDEFDKNPDEAYIDSAALYKDCCLYDLSTGYLDKKSISYTVNKETFSMKKLTHLPPFVCPDNYAVAPPYSRSKVKSDKPDEINIPLERLQQLAKSKNSYKTLVDICKKHNVERKGGKKFMISRLLALEDSSEIYQVIRKKFISLTGRSGGLLLSFCPHGCFYGVKILILPESVADYINLDASFKIPAQIRFSDIASLFAVHANNIIHNPPWFYPHGGRIASAEDARSELYKTGHAQAVLIVSLLHAAKKDPANFNKDTAHIITGQFGRWCLYDRFHQNNHHESDMHLRSIDNTNLRGTVNTSNAEQQNHILSLDKPFLNNMNINTYIKVIVYIFNQHNFDLNKEHKRVREKQQKVSTKLDNLGILTEAGVDKPDFSHCKFLNYITDDLKSSSHPQAVLQGHSKHKIDSLNSLIYLLSFSPIGASIIESADKISNSQMSWKSLIEYVSCESSVSFNGIDHERIVNHIFEDIRKDHPDVDVNCLSPAFLFDNYVAIILDKCEIVYANFVGFSRISASDVSICLETILNASLCTTDYVFMQNDGGVFLKGVKPQLNIDILDQSLKYTLVGYISFMKCFVSFDQAFYEISNTNITSISRENFVITASSASLLLYKLSGPIHSDNGAQIDKKNEVIDISDGEDLAYNVYNERPPPHKKQRLDKSIFNKHSNDRPNEPWLKYSSFTGRLDLSSEQRNICESINLWYDDSIMNSFAYMCLKYFKYTFVYQDTTIANMFDPGVFKSVDQSFIQILNVSNTHWICTSNALTYCNEPEVVEVFDSLCKESSLLNSKEFSTYLARHILQIRPQTTVIRYVKTQVQSNMYDCGPMALTFMYCLGKRHHPLCFGEHINTQAVRNKVKNAFTSNSFKEPILCMPRNVEKTILAVFRLDKSGRFNQS